MTVLLDTQIALWFLFEPDKLKATEKEVLSDESMPIVCHSISLFEISLKYSLGKLEIPLDPGEIPDLLRKSGCEIEEQSVSLFSTYHNLPKTSHKDPFDRLLIWHCIKNDYHLLSRDRMMGEYAQLGLKLL